MIVPPDTRRLDDVGKARPANQGANMPEAKQVISVPMVSFRSRGGIGCNWKLH
jgi:hypothetical protein